VKIRTGFVSNSSSSSFVLALSPAIAEACPHCGRKSRLKETLNDDGDGWLHSRTASEDLSRIVEHIEEVTADWGRSEELKRRALNEVDFLRGEGWQIILVEMSYHDYEARSLLDEEIKRGSAKMIFCGD